MYNVHGACVSVKSNEEGFLGFLSDNYRLFRRDEDTPSVTIRVHFEKRAIFGRSRDFSRHQTTGLDILGYDIFQFDNGIVSIHGPLSVKTTYDGELLDVDAIYTKDRRFQIREMANDISYVYEGYQQIMRLAVHFPVFWILGKKGYNLLHGSAVDYRGKSLLFLGLNGVGKTTLAVSLLETCKIMSDNFILFDKEFIYGFPECMRLPTQLYVEKLRDRQGPKVFGKRHWKLSRDNISLKSKPWKVFLLKLGSEFSLKALDRESALRRILAMNDYLHEFHCYSYLNLLGFETREDLYSSFLKGTECFELQIERNEPGKRIARTELDRLIE